MLDIKKLIQSPIFAGLTPAAAAQLLERINYQVKHYPPKSAVAMQGDKCNALLIVLSGMVQGQMLDFSGKLIVMSEIPALFPVAPAFIYAHKNEFPVNVVAMQDTTILFIRQPDFTDLLQKNKIILQNYLTIISDRSKFLSEKIQFLSFKSIKSKMAAFLLQKYQEQQAAALTVSETQQELADFFGVARPSLARVLREMKEEGSIDWQRKKVYIRNLSLLKREAM